jgi:outer membrane lipoprotein-sorting protein
MKRILIFLIGFFSILHAQKNGSYNAIEILQKVKQQFDAVNDYTATLTAKVEMERLHIPEMKIKIYFKQPNKVHVESKNFAMLPREGLALNPSDLLSKFDASLMGSEMRDDIECFKLRLVSKPEKNRPPRESVIWVDGARWVVTQLDATPMEGRTITVLFQYILVEGKYTLPASMKASFDFTSTTDTLTQQMYSGRNSIPRKGSVELQYSDYEVNKGLSDEIFEKKEKR